MYVARKHLLLLTIRPVVDIRATTGEKTGERSKGEESAKIFQCATNTIGLRIIDQRSDRLAAEIAGDRDLNGKHEQVFYWSTGREPYIAQQAYAQIREYVVGGEF
jgi:hypothetical protein